ncbi:MAG: MBL fold metallo-hydrolase [Clostridia bacterium]|nr:MBL fold metallo-hydrolase [Clostridia bacterium]
MKKFSVKKLLTAALAGVCCACTGLSVALLDDGVATASAATPTSSVEVYQLAPNAGYLLESYVIKTAGGKLIVIDGGTDGVYADDTAIGSAAALSAEAYLPAALRAIAGKADGEEVEVEAWFLSHAHRDHFSELGKIMSQGDASGVTINNFYFDFPDFGGSFPMTNSQQANLETLKTAFATYGYDYDALNGAVVNAESVEDGLSITVDGVRFDVLQTWAMSDGYYGDVNDTSMVIRMVAGDNSVLFLNDLAISGGERLTTTYTAAELTSDYVQLSHHGHAGMTKAQYNKFITEDTKLLWPTPSVTFGNPTDFMVDETYAWFNGNATYLTDGAADASKVDKTKNFFACLYDAYPADTTSVADWANCIAGMKVASFEYEYTAFDVLGASVRMMNPDGLRFVAQVEADALTDGAEYGMVLIPQDMDTGADLTKDTANALVIPATGVWSDELCTIYGIADGYKAFSCALIAEQAEGEEVARFPQEFYNRPITAVAYVTAGGETIYTEKVTRSIGYVATVESMKPTYEQSDLIDEISAATTVDFSVNGGATLTTTEACAPVFTVGNIATDYVTYTSDNEAAIKVVDGKVVAVADGIANITATMSLGGEKTIEKTVEVTATLTPVEKWEVLNDGDDVNTVAVYGDATKESTAREDGYAVSISATATIVITMTYNGAPLTAADVATFDCITMDVYAETANSFSLANGTQVAFGAGWNTITISADTILTEINANETQLDVYGGFYLWAPIAVAIDNFKAKIASQDAKLTTPVVEVWQDGTACWEAVEGATSYTYLLDGVENTTTDCFVKLANGQSLQVKAVGYTQSAYSAAVTYTQKDLLNGCEYNIDGWVATDVATITLNAGNATQGYFAYGITTAAWAELSLWLKKDFAPAVLENYEYIEMTINVVSTADCGLFGGTGETIVSLAYLTPGQQVVRIAVADLINCNGYDPATGEAYFYLGGAVSMYLDNIVGVARQTTLLNNCETISETTVYSYNAALKLSTEHVKEGTQSIQVTISDYQHILIWLKEADGSFANLSNYTYIKMTVYSENAGMKLLANDQVTVLHTFAQGENVICLPVSALSGTYNPENGAATFFVNGADNVLYFDNVIGLK